MRLEGKTFYSKVSGGFTPPVPYITSPRRAINPLADKRRPLPFVASLNPRTVDVLRELCAVTYNKNISPGRVKRKFSFLFGPEFGND